MASSLGSVRVAPVSSRSMHYDSGKDDYMYVLSVGPKFEYVIPGFDVFDLRCMRVQGYNDAGELIVLDVFVRDDPSLDCIFPAGMEVTDATCINPEDVRNGCKAIKVDDLLLLSDTVHVVWEWKWDNGEDSSDIDRTLHITAGVSHKSHDHQKVCFRTSESKSR